MIEYPVDKNSRWSVYDTSISSFVGKRRQKWPRKDGSSIEKLSPKLVMLRHTETEKPTINESTHTLTSGEVIDIENNEVRIEYSIIEKPIEEQIANIKNKAREKILARWPDWKQQNMTARAVELQEKRLTGNSLTPEEEAELTALASVWELIKSIRTYSNQLEILAQNKEAYDLNDPWPGEE